MATKKNSAKAPTATTLPMDFTPNDWHKGFAKLRGVDLDASFDQFVMYYTASGKKFVNWDFALRLWLKRAADNGWNRVKPGPSMMCTCAMRFCVWCGGRLMPTTQAEQCEIAVMSCHRCERTFGATTDCNFSILVAPGTEPPKEEELTQENEIVVSNTTVQ